MPKITFEMPSGEKKVCEAEVGKSVMQTAVANLVDGIVADCGGYATCATCHVYVDETWFGRLPAAEPDEEDMLEVADEPQPNSRLSCQIQVQESYDGLLVHVPSSSL